MKIQKVNCIQYGVHSIETQVLNPVTIELEHLEGVHAIEQYLGQALDAGAVRGRRGGQGSGAGRGEKEAESTRSVQE